MGPKVEGLSITGSQLLEKLMMTVALEAATDISARP